MRCKYCEISLTENNCYPSDFSRGGYICKSCRKVKYKENITKRAQQRYSKSKSIKLKSEIISAYGSACVCCGETGWPFLSIDHKNNDGALHRRQCGIGSGAATYRLLKQQGYPKDRFRLLCMNCNSCYGFHGFCGHDLHQSSEAHCKDCGRDLIQTGRFSKRFQLYDVYNLPLCKSCVIVRKFGSVPITQSKRDEKAKSLNLRLKLLHGYGGACACCGERNPFFLTVDHINNNGAEERRQFGNNMYKFYRFLISKEFPKENYQLLCYNCNCSKGSYGQCYHKMPKEYRDISVYYAMIKEGVLQ